MIFLGGKRRFEVVSDVCCRTNRDFCFGVVQAKLLARRRYDAAGRAGEYEHDASGELPHYVLLGEHVCRSQCAWKSDRCELQINLVALDDSDRMETDHKLDLHRTLAEQKQRLFDYFLITWERRIINIPMSPRARL